MSKLYSKQFNDIYFSEEDGKAESLYTFINANDIPARLYNNSKIVIGELGFGSGLNLLNLILLVNSLGKDIQVDFWTVEKYPLTKTDIFDGLKKWDELIPVLNEFCSLYPKDFVAENIYKIEIGKVTLNLCIGEAVTCLDMFPPEIDCWFLDGFAPDKNPAMWSVDILSKCYKKSSEDATCSTFTAAGFVKRNLREAGFIVKRLKGFGKKRHMIKAYKKDSN